MVGLLGIPLDYVTPLDMTEGWTAAKNHYNLKYQGTQIGTNWEANKMTVYTKIKDYWLDGEDWSWIKEYNAQKDILQATSNLRDNYEGSGEFNKRVAWEMANIDNAQFMSEHTY